MLSEDAIRAIEGVIKRYSEKRGGLLPTFHIVQKDRGWISEEAIEEIARILDIPPIEVKEAVSFYTMFNTREVGKYHIQVCTNLSCSLLGGRHIVDYLERRLGVDVGKTREDKRFTLSEVECLGSCGTAPVMQINEDYYENLTEDKIDRIIGSLA
ncbi:MAG: NADH-quinone oxidoreductase subunit NuoE [Nitrospinae bacterium]|nr:NADH-quinone oxidoreductase subunit NuoE [Nitrospinota bacterium]